MYKAGRKLELFSHSSLAFFPLLVMQQSSSFFKQVCFFLKHTCALLVFFQSGALYANIRHDPKSEYNQRISERSEHQRTWGVCGCSETPLGVLVGEAP